MVFNKKIYQKEYDKKYYQKNQDKIKLYQKIYRLKNPEKIKNYRLKNEKRIKLYRQLSSVKNNYNIWNKKYSQTPDRKFKSKIRQEANRMLKKGLLKKEDHCNFCYTKDNLTLDHKKYINRQEHIQTLCLPCNIRKDSVIL